MPKRGKKNAAQTQREREKQLVALRQQHSAVESEINSREHHGLNRCLDVGLKGYLRHVGFGGDELQPAWDRTGVAGANARLQPPALTREPSPTGAVSLAPENDSGGSAVAQKKQPEPAVGHHPRPSSSPKKHALPARNYFGLKPAGNCRPAETPAHSASRPPHRTPKTGTLLVIRRPK